MNSFSCANIESLQETFEFSSGLMDMLGGGSRGVPMVQIHATLDDVGSCGKDGISAVVGYVAYSSIWSKFNWRWLISLEQLNRPFLHTAKYLNEFPLADGKITDEDICLILAPFIEAVKGTLLQGGAIPICVITECDAYSQLTEQEKKFVRPPEENSFEIAVAASCQLLRNPLNITDAISVQMDESANAPKLYSRYEAMKRDNEILKGLLGALCFCDDRRHPPVQAADMLGNIFLKTFRKFEAKEDMPRAMREVTEVNGQSRLIIHRYNLDGLRRLAELRSQQKSKMHMPEPL